MRGVISMHSEMDSEIVVIEVRHHRAHMWQQPPLRQLAEDLEAHGAYRRIGVIEARHNGVRVLRQLALLQKPKGGEGSQHACTPEARGRGG